MTKPFFLFRMLPLLLAASCRPGASSPGTNGAPTDQPPLFSTLPAAQTGIDFRNDLVYDKDFNIYRYRNFYNGGGVAIGDVDKNGLPDIFFTSNMGKNKLYLNKGDWKFEDVSEKAGIAGKGSWATGVAMADVNGDGWLDIYVCNSGNPRSDEKENQLFSRENELFINNGGAAGQWSGRFSEQAQAYGLADRGLSTHAAFFDYDRDGDLDMYMLNNSFRPIGSFDLRRNLRYTRDSLGGHKLYRNNRISPGQKNPAAETTFTDVSAEAGILGSVIAFGLGVTVGDLDMDGWQDIYVSNDFFERDYLYHNNGDGTFTEQLEKSMRHISAASMGADMADINNDAYPDIFVTDMLPEPDYRIKTTTSFDSPDRFKYTTANGYYNQFTRNMLHLNNGDGSFSEIACLANAEATDWSWGALMFDMDNDGWKDIFVANGIAQDLTNQDYLMFAADPVVQEEIIAGGSVDFKRLIDSIPSEKQPNYAFQNHGGLQFANHAAEWGLATPSFSNGSAYGDLDNDGDLDLVVNNVNMEAFVYRNEANKLLKNNHFLKFELEGEALNTQALGAKIFLRAGGQTLYQEQMPMRGFQSSMDPRPNFGLGASTKADTVWVVWPGAGKMTLLTNVQADQTLRLRQQEANHPAAPIPWLETRTEKLFEPAPKNAGLAWAHRESHFSDWDRDRLLYFLYSADGPRAAVGDVNGDKREDVFLCGAAGQAGALLLQSPDGTFQASKQPAFAQDAACEDVDAEFFDADGDGDLDLYVASGSNEFQPLSRELGDRLYLNNGKGQFARKADALPGEKPFASACVCAADWDGDGDTDLFVGMRLLPGKVGVPVGGYLLQNDGTGYFAMLQPDILKSLGLITDAVWADADNDGDPDLMVVGEWMAPSLFRNDPAPAGQGRRLTLVPTGTNAAGKLTGLWKRVAAGDVNKDGRPDFLLGNTGLNTRLKAQAGNPLTLFFNDFDNNGTPEQILCRYNFGTLLPYTLRGDLVGNLPSLKKKYLHFRNYANKQMQDIFSPEQLKNAIKLEAETLSSGILLSDNIGGYTFSALPVEAQFAPIYALAIGDLDGDGNLDALAAGNQLGAKPEFGYVDADYGLVLKGDGKGHFTPIRSKASGLRLNGEIRDLILVQCAGKPALLVAANNTVPEVFLRTAPVHERHNNK